MRTRLIVAGLVVIAAVAVLSASADPALASGVIPHRVAPQAGTVLAVQALTIALQAPEPQKEVKVEIDVHRGGGRWYVNPVWIAIGAIALVLLVLLIALAVRGGGGSTIVK